MRKKHRANKDQYANYLAIGLLEFWGEEYPNQEIIDATELFIVALGKIVNKRRYLNDLLRC